MQPILVQDYKVCAKEENVRMSQEDGITFTLKWPMKLPATRATLSRTTNPNQSQKNWKKGYSQFDLVSLSPNK